MKSKLLILFIALAFSCEAQFYGLNQNYREGINYGFLYNGYVYDDTGDNSIFSSDEWRLPTTLDFDTLSDYLGGDAVSGGKMKEIGYEYWTLSNTGTNDVGFNARGAGDRDGTIGDFGSLKTTNIIQPGKFGRAQMGHSVSTLIIASTGNNAHQGRSVRLIRVSTTLSHGEEGTYTGNDGRIYRTIGIGNPVQEWLADNLVETQRRDNSWIQGYDSGVYTSMSDAAWIALTTSALCAYDDDEANAFE